MRILVAVLLLLAWSSPVHSFDKSQDKFTMKVLRRIAAANTIDGMPPFVWEAFESTHRDGELTASELTAKSAQLKGRAWILRGTVISILKQNGQHPSIVLINIIENSSAESYTALLYDFGPKMAAVGMDVDAYGVLVGNADVEANGMRQKSPLLYSALVCPHYWLQTQLLNSAKAR